jgi:hypothetical protein
MQEVTTISRYNGPVEKLGKCEQFFKAMSDVPRINAKLTIFILKYVAIRFISCSMQNLQNLIDCRFLFVF